MMGLAPSELYAMELSEFSAAYQGWQKLQETRMREGMERARWSVARIVGPWMSETNRTVFELWPLPWDSTQEPSVAEADITMDLDARRERVANLIKKLRKDE